MDLGAAKFVVDTGINPNVVAGTMIWAQEMTTGAVPETFGITDTFPTKAPAEGRPIYIAGNPVL